MLLGIGRDPLVGSCIGDEESSALATECRHDIYVEIREGDGDGLSAAANFWGTRVRFAQDGFDAVKECCCSPVTTAR